MYKTEIDNILFKNNLKLSFLLPDKKGKRKIIELSEFLAGTNSKIMYIKSGSTGHTFKGMINSDNKQINYAIKVSAYPRKKKYGYITNINRPENVDIYILELLSKLQDKTPHLITPYGSFFSSIYPLMELNIQKNKKFEEFKKNNDDNMYHKKVSILISEWAYKGDLHEYIRKTVKKKKDTRFLKIILFQIIYTLAVIQQEYPSFRHNDLKLNNILVQKNTDRKKSIFINSMKLFHSKSQI